jgi:hypothetical protein
MVFSAVIMLLCALAGDLSAQSSSVSNRFGYRIAILGYPIDLAFHYDTKNPMKEYIASLPAPKVEWNRENLNKLKALGFNVIQLNIAWGYRPMDEPLNLEDVVDLPPGLRDQYAQPLPLSSQQTPERIRQRREDLHARIKLAKEAGFRTIFHFGAPYNDHQFVDAPPNCLLDGKTPERYVHLLEAFGKDYPGVDDVFIYTFDQNAWLCDEFGTCPRCIGKPLHERLVPFLQQMVATWHKVNPQGRVWWQPRALSAGEIYECILRMDSAGFGLSINSNIEEVMSTVQVDRGFKNICHLASQRGIPVVGETFLGGASEELEPYRYLSHPLVTLHALRTFAAVPGLKGIKEFYGLIPTIDDPNLRMTALFFSHPQIDDETALQRLAAPYGDVQGDMIRFWKLTSEAMELFPWETSWFIREIGRSDPVHGMTAAAIPGPGAHDPANESSGRAVFMKMSDNREPDPWMLEDVQLRCDLAAERMGQASEIGRGIEPRMPQQLQADFAEDLRQLAGFRQRALAYVYHLRETNLAGMMRRLRERGEPVPQRMLREMTSVLREDQQNEQQTEPIGSALTLLAANLDAFLKTYFVVTPDQRSLGDFSLTSR